MTLRVGVLALQGDFEAHGNALRRAAQAEGAQCDVVEVRRPAELAGLGGLEQITVRLGSGQ